MGRKRSTPQTEFDFESLGQSLLSDFSSDGSNLGGNGCGDSSPSLNVSPTGGESKTPSVENQETKSDSLSLEMMGQKIKPKKPQKQETLKRPNATFQPSVGITDEEAQFQEPEIFTVSEINNQIKNLLEGEFPLIWIKGEISNFKVPPSGHFYFSLKDSKAQIRSVMFKGHNSKLNFEPEDGMEVLVRARVSVYAPRGDYQIICEMMDPVGQGALQLQFEQLKKKLSSEGLFDQAMKKQLPTLPKRIAIVTSPTGAAIQDMLNVLNRRYRGAEITLIPASVQGAKAPREIKAGIEIANQVVPKFDVMIVGRGGGSIEDLWSFNDEGVARAIAASEIPVVSAVGHEVDFTIADFVADLRAPTPSAAAELVVKNASDLVERIHESRRLIGSHIERKIQWERQQLNTFRHRLIDPRRRLQEFVQRCDELVGRLESGISRNLIEFKTRISNLRSRLGNPRTEILHSSERLKSTKSNLVQSMKIQLKEERSKLHGLMAVLDSLSPLQVVHRGYSIARREGVVVKTTEGLKIGDHVEVQLAKGKLKTEIKEIEN